MPTTLDRRPKPNAVWLVSSHASDCCDQTMNSFSVASRAVLSAITASALPLLRITPLGAKGGEALRHHPVGPDAVSETIHGFAPGEVITFSVHHGCRPRDQLHPGVPSATPRSSLGAVL